MLKDKIITEIGNAVILAALGVCSIPAIMACSIVYGVRPHEVENYKNSRS